MKRLAIWTGLLLAGLLAGEAGLSPANTQAGPPNTISCNKVNNGSSGATVGVSVAPITGQVISICGFNANSGAAAGTFQLIGGTGATCATSTVTLTQVMPLPINGSIVDHIGNAWFTLPPLDNLCISITGTGPVSYNIYYAQF